MLKNKAERRRDEADKKKLADLKAANSNLKKFSIAIEILCIVAVGYALFTVKSYRDTITFFDALPLIAVVLATIALTYANLRWHSRDEKNKLSESKAEEARKNSRFGGFKVKDNGTKNVKTEAPEKDNGAEEKTDSDENGEN